MTTTLTHSFLPKHELPTPGGTDWKSLLLEPLMIAGTCFFWLTVLPVTGLFCASVAIYDKVASLRKGNLRLPNLRSNAGHNPLVLRKKSVLCRNSRPAGEQQRPGLSILIAGCSRATFSVKAEDVVTGNRSSKDQRPAR